MFSLKELQKNVNYGAVKIFSDGGWRATIVEPDTISPVDPSPTKPLQIQSTPRIENPHQSKPSIYSLEGGRTLKVWVLAHEEETTSKIADVVAPKPEDELPPHVVIDFEMRYPDKPPDVWDKTLKNGEEYQGEGYKIVHEKPEEK